VTGQQQTCRLDGCDNPTTNQLCNRCLTHLERNLGDIPAHLAELTTTISRQDRITRTTSRPPLRAVNVGPGTPDNYITGEALPVPVNLEAAELGDDCRITVESWVETISGQLRDDVPVTDTFGRVAYLLRRGVPWARIAEDGPQFADEVRDVVRRVRRAVDRPPERWFAGPCHAPVDGSAEWCQLDLYAKPGADDIVCDGFRQGSDGCGATHTVTDRREWLLTSAADTLLPLRVLWEALYALTGSRVTWETVRKWPRGRPSQGVRPRLEARSVSMGGEALFRGEDVLRLVADEDARPGARRRGRVSA
jgi:hypothetical protein